MHRLFAAVIALAALVIALLLGMQLGARQAMDADGAPSTAVSTGEAADVAVLEAPATPRAPGSAATTPLPPVNTPLGDVFDDLAARADRGDHHAACRLALELQACRHDLELARVLAEGAARHVPVDMSALDSRALAHMESVVAHGERTFDHFETLAAHCKGVPEVSFGRHLGWWRQAAFAGQPTAVHEYVGGEAFPAHLWIRESTHLPAYRRDLEGLAWQTMQSGDLEMAWRLMNAYVPNPAMMRTDPLAQVLDPDVEMALALALYLRDATDAASDTESTATAFGQMARTQIAELDTRIEPAGVERAEARSREWLQAITPQPIDFSPFHRYRFGEEEGQRYRESRMKSCDSAS